MNHGEIYFIDFSLAKLCIYDKNFDNYNKFVNNKHFECPKMYNKERYNGSKADIWSLGVCLIMMIFNVIPYNIPSSTDHLFRNIINDLHKWSGKSNRAKYVDKHALGMSYYMLFIDHILLCLFLILYVVI